MSGAVDVARACGCQDSDDGNPWCFVVDPPSCVEAEQARSPSVAHPFATPTQVTAPKRTALAGAAPIHMVLLRRQALRPVQHATATASSPTTAPCHAPATTRTPASTDVAVCATRATVNPAAAVAYSRRPPCPPAPTGPTIDSLTDLGAKPAARRPAALDARHGVLAHADRHCPNRNTESRLLHGGAPACPNTVLGVSGLASCASSARHWRACAARRSHRE